MFGPGLAAPRGVLLKVPIRGEGARTGDPAFEAAVVLEVKWSIASADTGE